jgi:hypothetical protein
MRSVQIQRELLAGGLRSDEAKCLLASLSTADELMPELSLDELEQPRRCPSRSSIDADEGILGYLRQRAQEGQLGIRRRRRRVQTARARCGS